MSFWLFLGWTEAFPFRNSIILIVVILLNWLCVRSWELMCQWTGYSTLLGLLFKSFTKPCHFTTVYIISNLQETKKGRKKEAKESPRNEERTKRTLEFKLVELSGILELPWPKGLPLAFIARRSAASRTRGLCAHELVTGWPSYLWVTLPILGSTLLKADTVK